MKRFLVCALASSMFALPAFAERFAIVGATVFDGTGAAPALAVVIVNDDMIESVTPGTKAPKGVKVVKAKGLALLPGFFDVHTHYTPGGLPATPPQISAAYVAAGVTTVNDFHQPPEAWATRRAWQTEFPGPHINLTARTSTKGGHGADWADQNTTKLVDTPEAAAAAIEELLPYKPDFIKAFADGWRYGSGIDNTSMNLPTLTALVKAAHAHNLRVGTHTVTVERGKIAAKAGVDIIVHSLQDVVVDKETIDLMLANKTSYAPTLAVYEPAKPGQPTPSEDQLKQRTPKFEIALKNVKALHDAGVRVVTGTDAGMPGTVHGVATLREMELLVQAGLTPTEALVAGTRAAAGAMGEDDRGVIAPGKRADLVLIAGKPWDDIAEVRKTVQTFVDGAVMFGQGAPKPYRGVSPAPTPLAEALIADFEGKDMRTAQGALPITNADGGIDRSSTILTAEMGEAGGRYLSVTSLLSHQKDARTEAILPLTPGGLTPVDASTYQGIQFDVRGDGPYEFGVGTVSAGYSAGFQAGPKWTTVTIPFSSLKPEGEDHGEGAAWSAKELLAIRFVTKGPAGTTDWLKVDNVKFY